MSDYWREIAIEHLRWCDSEGMGYWEVLAAIGRDFYPGPIRRDVLRELSSVAKEMGRARRESGGGDEREGS